MNPPSILHREIREPASAASLVGFSEEQLRFLAESLPQIAWTGMPNGYIDFMNGRWFEYTGLTAEETYNEQKTAVHPEDFLRYQHAWKEAVRLQKPYEVEYRFKRASDGHYHWHLGRGLPVRDMHGNVIKWFGTCTDIHAQKMAGEEMRMRKEELEVLVEQRTAYLEQEIEQRRKTERKYFNHVQLLQSMINTLPMAAVAVHANGKILHANESFYRLFATSGEERSLTDTFCDALLYRAQKKLRSPGWEHFFARLGRPDAFTSEIFLEDGRTLSLEYIPGGGERGSYLLLVRDISAEKQLDAVKAEFMSLASHQLRTPLTSVRWALSRLSKMLGTRVSPQERALLEKSRESISGMAQTIRTMLSISRMEAGLNNTVALPVHLHQFFWDFMDPYREMARNKNISLQLQCPEDLVVETDFLLLKEIFENLLTNAIKYTPALGEVHVKAWKENGDIVLQVQDTGMGIPHEEQEKVFTKFFRASNIVPLETSGTGLGLYLVWKLTEALKGSIGFTSKEDKGTTFALRLPAKQKQMIA